MRIFPSLILLLLLVATGCTTVDNDRVLLKIWALGAEGENVKKLIPAFEKENPSVTVKVQMFPWTAAQEKLITAFASDNLPDVFQLGNTWIPQFSSLESIQPLNKLIENSPVIKKENYFEGIWETNVIDSVVFGIPWYIDTRVLFYRTDVFERVGYNHPPATWEELYDVSLRIKKTVGIDEKYAIYLPANEWASFVIFGLQNGADLLKENACYGNFSSPEFKSAFEYLIKFHKQGLAPIGISQTTNIYQAFSEEYISMYISGPWNIREFKKWMTDSLSDKWMTAELPGPDKNTPGVSLAGGSSLVVSKQSLHKDFAWKLVEFLSRPETQLQFYHLVNDLPAVKSAWQDSIFVNDPYMQAFFNQFHHVVPTPKVAEWEQIAFSKVQHYAEFAIRGALTVDDALAKLDSDVDRILEKRRWILENKN
ncbi:MAG: sugar ABC transporter substrate-binding protein [Calditrichae bacterium]|nr:sugar ABC transporter substrate-binding protein [Calditrichia bacterium]